MLLPQGLGIGVYLLEEESKIAGKLYAILLPERDEIEKDAGHLLVIRQHLIDEGLGLRV
jgi:hypothetical protein